MAKLTCFKTTEIEPRDRLSRWDAAVWGGRTDCHTSIDAGSLFAGTATFSAIGPMHIFRIVAGAHQRHCPGVTARARSGMIELVAPWRGSATIAQCGRQVQLQPGGWTLCDADRPYRVTTEQEGDHLVFLMPRARLGLGNGLSVHAARDFATVGGTARLLPRYLAGLVDEIAGIDDTNCSELADMAAQLVRLSLLEARHAVPQVSMRETLRLRVQDYVRRNLRDPQLSIERVAAAFGCTKRHLHKVFSGEEATLSQFIWQQRLECCREALVSPRLARSSITEIAFMWGFNNSAHFSKAFKERFGLPPGHFRERSATPPRLPGGGSATRGAAPLLAAA